MDDATKLRAARMQAPVTVRGLRRLAAKITEPHREDDKVAMLEAAELIEKMAGLLPVELAGPTRDALADRLRRAMVEQAGGKFEPDDRFHVYNSDSNMSLDASELIDAIAIGSNNG